MLVRLGLTFTVFIIDMLVWGGDSLTTAGHTVPVPLVVVVAAVLYGTLLSHKHPLLGYGAMLVLSLGTLLVPAAANLAGFLLALFLVARQSPAATARWALVGASVPVSANMIASLNFHAPVPVGFAFLNLGLWCVLVIVVWLAGRALGRTAARLRAEKLRSEAAREEAIVNERLRISRDLHDSVAHSLTAILLQVAGIRALHSDRTRQEVEPAELERVLSDIQTTAEQSMRELHRMLGMLRERAGSLEDTYTGKLSEVPVLVASAQAAGLAVQYQISGLIQPVDPSIEHAGYRLVQEGLSNAMKHGGPGSKVSVDVMWTRDHLRVSIRSHSGITPISDSVSGGFGLIGLRERVSVSGGSLTAGPTEDGFLIDARLPISPESTSLPPEVRKT
ncbi:sensor histidine kinase [Micrococcoides hystricis]|uniref:histidine kinase n=1 Tax=Micrococcoides hystricis TaxID=1572761 RepID=A0ABV6P850_9MICC